MVNGVSVQSCGCSCLFAMGFVLLNVLHSGGNVALSLQILLGF